MHAVSTMACSAVWSIGLRADAVCVDGVATIEHPAIRRAAPTRKLAIWRCPRRRRDSDCPMNVRTSFLRSSPASKPKQLLERANEPSDGRFGRRVSDKPVLGQPFNPEPMSIPPHSSRSAISFFPTR